MTYMVLMEVVCLFSCLCVCIMFRDVDIIKWNRVFRLPENVSNFQYLKKVRTLYLSVSTHNYTHTHALSIIGV